MKVPKTDAETLYITLRDVCIWCTLPLDKAYDGASNMYGHVCRVAAQVKPEQNRDLHIHCLARSLNLCLQDAARLCIPVISMVKQNISKS